MDLVIQGLADAGFQDIVKPDVFPDDHIHAVHDRGFVRFLEVAYSLWKKEFGPGGFATAYTFGMRGMDQVPNESVHSMLSCYTFDVCVPSS